MENALFEKTPVPKAYMKLALPVVFSMMVSLIYNMVDTYFIALTGVQELVAGVSLVVPVCYLDDSFWRYIWTRRKFTNFTTFWRKKIRRGKKSQCVLHMGSYWIWNICKHSAYGF